MCKFNTPVVVLWVCLFSGPTVRLQENPDTDDAYLKEYRSYFEVGELDDYAELWGTLPDVMTRMRTSSFSSALANEKDEVEPMDIIRSLNSIMSLLMLTSPASEVDDESDATIDHPHLTQETSDDERSSSEAYVETDVDDQQIVESDSAAATSESASFVETLRKLTNLSKKCTSLVPGETAYCLGGCRYSIFRNAMKNVSMPWKPKYPLISAAHCDGKFYYKMWNFGLPLGLNIFLMEDSIVEGWSVEDAATQIMETRRDEILEWNLHGVDPYDEPQATLHPENKQPDLMVIIGNDARDSFSINWNTKGGDTRVRIQRLRCGTFLQEWKFGPSVSVQMGTLEASFYSIWRLGEATLTHIIDQNGKSTVVWEPSDMKDVRALKNAARAIDEWCDQNSAWVMLPCKIHKITDELIESM